MGQIAAELNAWLVVLSQLLRLMTLGMPLLEVKNE